MVMPLIMAINGAEEQQPAVLPATRPTRGAAALSHSHACAAPGPPSLPRDLPRALRTRALQGPLLPHGTSATSATALHLSPTARKLRCENRAAQDTQTR